jgi:predicted enzyme related to lactoylglutathione lyase
MDGPSYFEIQADDTKRAAKFYAQVFGWKFEEAPGLPYWRVTTSGPRGGLLKRPTRAPSPGQGTNAFVCSMQVDDFDKIAKNILNHAGAVALPKFAVPRVCWQGYFLDTEGNTFDIFQPDASAA